MWNKVPSVLREAFAPTPNLTRLPNDSPKITEAEGSTSPWFNPSSSPLGTMMKSIPSSPVMVISAS